MKKIRISSKGEAFSGISALFNLASLIAFCIYAAVYSYYDYAVFAGLIIGLYGSVIYIICDHPLTEVGNFVTVVAVTVAFGIFALNSYPVWADRVNHISMYGSRGTLVPVIAIIILMIFTILFSVIACFSAGKEGKRQGKNKKATGIISGCTVLILVAVYLINGKTTVGTNGKSYISNVSSITATLLNLDSTSTGKASSVSANANAESLEAVTDFEIDEEGNYSFTGTDEASYYLIYFCTLDAVNDDDGYLYCSSSIESTGAVNYSGNFADIFDYSYGAYLVKVFAFPDLDDEEHTMSTAATNEFVVTGELSAPEMTYYWNTFDNTFGIQIANMDAYAYETYPDNVVITISNTEDENDVITLTIENITADSYAAETSDLTRNESYDIKAVATTSSEFVTGDTTVTTIVATDLCVGEQSVITENYEYSDGSSYFKFPRVCSDFDLSGGNAGQPDGVTFICEAKETSEGSSYSYDMVIEPFDGKYIDATLELKEDGTFILEEAGWGPIGPGSVEGIWVENGDGTATLSYDPQTVDF